MSSHLARIILAGLMTVFLTSGASALETTPVRSSHATVSLITNTDAILPNTEFKVGLYLRLTPGWHTYWRNPGDAGVAPELTIDSTSETHQSPIEWPTPERIVEGTLTTFSYRGDVLLPVRLKSSTAPVLQKAHASWLVCRDICVPEEGDFTLSVPQGVPSASPEASLFSQAILKTPGVSPFRALITPDGTLSLEGDGLPPSVVSAQFFPSDDGQTESRGAQTPLRETGGLALHLALGTSFDPLKPLDGVLSLTAGDGSVKSFTISAAPGPAVVMAAPQHTILLLLAALGGGLLLNLMPCVFPVLAMKAMSLARLSSTNRRTVRLEAGTYTLGVVTAFTALGTTLLLFRSAGDAAGWGFQFQSPIFVTAMAWVLFATGLNMSGVFAVGERLAGAGQPLAAKGAYLGSFFTGVLAVIVATPCTASFMGIAIAGALAAPPPLGLLIFTTMGLGLALPHIAFAVVPRLASLLPRPGQWMVTVRQVLAFPMYAAAAWLVWVVSQQSGPSGVLAASLGLVGVGFAAWLFGVAQMSSGRRRSIGFAFATATSLGTAGLLWTGSAVALEQSEPFSPTRLAELQKQGRPVFVNMTASWCLTCLVNEQIALSPTAVRNAFAQAHVAYLKGDWTRQDPAISTYLRDHGRDGVPLYVFYPPGSAPVVLPQLLSEGSLLDQVAKLGS